MIGETALIGNHCVMFHNVTLGGTSKYDGQRHPIVGDHVFIGTNAILLGPIRVGDHAKIGANAFVINHDVPAHATVVGTPARVVKLAGQRVDLELPRTVPPGRRRAGRAGRVTAERSEPRCGLLSRAGVDTGNAPAPRRSR